jgi:hypothetical protein
MLPQDSHPAARYETDVGEARRRATAAIVALGLIGVGVYQVPVDLWQYGLAGNLNAGAQAAHDISRLSDTFAQIDAYLKPMLGLVTAVLFLRWLHLVVRLTRALGGAHLRWTPSSAVWAFFIPVLNFFRPYQVLRDVYRQLAPDKAPEPSVQVVADGSEGYRAVRIVTPPQAAKVPAVSIAAWWALFWLGDCQIHWLDAYVNYALVSDALKMASAGLAILMVRAVTAQLVERFRRVRHNPVDILRAVGITVT